MKEEVEKQEEEEEEKFVAKSSASLVTQCHIHTQTDTQQLGVK